MSKTLEPQFPEEVIKWSPWGITLVYHVGVPSNSTAGYAVGCMALNMSTGIWYQNTGTNTSSTWTVFGGGSSITAPTGSPGAVTTVQTAFNEIYANLVTAQGFIPLNLQDWRAIASNDIPALAGTPASGILASDSAPKFKRVNAATDKCLKIEWAASSVIEITQGFYYPPDMDITAAYTVNLRVKMGGGADTPTTAIGVFEGIGGSNIGGTSGAASSTLSTVSVSVTPVAAHPNFASVSLTPGSHGTDTYAMHEAYILYNKKVLTS